MDDCIGISHPGGGPYLNNGEQGTMRTPPGGPSAPARHVYGFNFGVRWCSGIGGAGYDDDMDGDVDLYDFDMDGGVDFG
ncbi:hypothetical protein CTI12_AA278140 [Artemisia annua]|uniref:Uncharacterized protein n=1 Tax=Artemisia annua TaxID=35608 RepID=A0A2U1NDX0_ARTAN|nr:hypothetical protein CTI12_AA278140 [Artemisia annua]